MHVCMYAYMNIRTSCFRDSDLVVEFLSITVFCQIWLKSPEYSNENEYSIRAEMIISIFCLHFFRGRPGDFLCSAWRRWCNIMAQGGQLWPQTYKNWKGKHKKSSNKTQKMKDSCGSIWKLSHAGHHRPSAPKTGQISDKVQLLGIKYQTAIFRNWRQIEMK